MINTRPEQRGRLGAGLAQTLGIWLSVMLVVVMTIGIIADHRSE